MITIRNTNERYGDSSTFITGETLEDAVATMQKAVRDCGPEFADVVIGDDDYNVIYAVSDDSSEVEIEAGSPEEAAQEFVDDGDWWDDGNLETKWIHVYVDPPGEQFRVTLDPEEPACNKGEHAWESPYSVFGGLKENPGVFGHGGGIIRKEICRHCGLRKTTDTWATDPATGEQGLRSVSYETE